MVNYKYVIVGAGLSGLTVAERIANELDEKVLIIEKRDHIGGNVYDFYKDGILIQKYGPHIYHTNYKKVHDYLSKFTEWTDYVHKVLSYVDDKLVPMPICIDTLNKLYDLDLDENSMKEWIDEHKEDIEEIKLKIEDNKTRLKRSLIFSKKKRKNSIIKALSIGTTQKKTINA